MKPKVSVICPVFNAEKYLERSIASIKGQTMSEWELILVDDGSMDNSARICDTYASADSRIRVIHQINSGVGAARQVGLDAAIGDYVIHCDADDWADPSMLEEMLAKAYAEDADIVISDYYQNDGSQDSYVRQQPTDVNDNHQIIIDLSNFLFGALWNKLIRRQIIIDYSASFRPGINYCEDVLFLYQLILKPVKFAYQPSAYYHYVKTEMSITNKKTKKIFENRLKAYSELQSLLDLKKYPDNGQAFLSEILRDALRSSDMDGKSISPIGKQCHLSWLLHHTGSGRMKLAYVFLKMGMPNVAKKIAS